MLDVCIQAATAYQRADLSARLEATGRRLADPLFHTLVVGEFKQGKSSLINELLGTDVCPVDDDVATAVPTMLRWAETPTAVITRNPPADATAAAVSTSEIVPIDQVPTYVSEAGNPANERQVESVEIGLPSDLLRSGLVLVDTPGVGGLGSTHSAITIGVLPMADAVLFVSDAAQEFSGPELEFLHTARSLCPNVGCVVTKVDFYPAWRKSSSWTRSTWSTPGCRRRCSPCRPCSSDSRTKRPTSSSAARAGSWSCTDTSRPRSSRSVKT